MSRLVIVIICDQPNKENMKVKDLIGKLYKLDPDLRVICVEDVPMPLHNDYPSSFEIVDINSQKVVTSRDSRSRFYQVRPYSPR